MEGTAHQKYSQIYKEEVLGNTKILTPTFMLN